MAYVYKKFNSSDIAKVPFNAHKQYNFPSSSAASNKLTFYSARYTSESISLYSSASSAYGSDIKNITKLTKDKHYELLETLAEDIFFELFKNTNINKIKLKIEKTQIIKNTSSVGIEITKKKYDR